MMKEMSKISQNLRDTTLAVGESVEIEKVLDAILTSAHQVVAYDMASIMLLDGNQLHIVRSSCDLELTSDVFYVDNVPHFQHIIQTREPVFVQNVQSDSDWTHLEGTGWIKSYIGLPILTQQGVLGVLNVDGKEANQFRMRDVAILEVFAAQAGLAIRNAKLFRDLQDITQSLETRVKERTNHLQGLANRVETILNHASDAIILADEHLRIVQENFAFEHLFGYSQDELFKQPLHQLIAPEFNGVIDDIVSGLAHKANNKRLECVAIRKDGSRFMVELSLAAIKSNSTTEYVCTIHDVSESLQMMSALLMNEARTRAILDAALDCIISIDSEGNFIEFNPAAERTFGYTRDQVIGKPMSDMIMPAGFREMHHGGMERFLSTKKSRVLNQRLELPARRADGSEFPMEITIVPVETDDTLFFTAYLRDITERKQAEQALKDSEAKFKSVFESSHDGIILHDFKGNIIDVNQRVLEMLQYEYDEMLKLTLPQLHPESEHPTAIAAQTTVQMDGAVQFRVDFMRKNGDLFPAEVSASLTEIDGQTAVQGIVRDVTERANAEEELRESLDKEREVGELKSRFVAMASHELRTPLATISSTNELLQEYFDEMSHDERQERFNRIENQVQHMTNLLEGVLTIGKIDAGTYVFRPREFNIEVLSLEIIGDVLASFRHSHPVEFACVGEDKLLTADAQLIRQSLINLLSNAMKYSARGSVVEFRIEVMDDAVELMVSDNGIGIPESDREHLFQRFHRGTNTTGISGTGLGLSIVKYAMDLHGGDVTFTSEVSKGTAFYLRIPKVSEVTNG